MHKAWEKVIIGLIFGVKLQFMRKKYFVRLKAEDDSHSLLEVLHWMGEVHVHIIDHFLTDDRNDQLRIFNSVLACIHPTSYDFL